MSDNTTPARIFLSTLGSLMNDPSRRVAIDKHNTREGRVGDSKAPGDPKGFRYAHPPHKEIGGVGTGEELPSQEPHGDRGMDNKGSQQTVMILLRAAALLFGNNGISSWNALVTQSSTAVWDEASRVFGSEQNVRDIIDSLPERSEGENINIEDVPKELLNRFYVRDGASKPPTEPNQPQKPEPVSVFTPKDIPVLAQYLNNFSDQELEQALSKLTDQEFRAFQDFTPAEKMGVLVQLMLGLPFNKVTV